MLLQGNIDQVTGLVSGAKDLTLVGALIVAVGKLWANSAKKDDQLLASTKVVTEALTMSAASQQELRHVLEESIKVKQELAVAIKEFGLELHTRPCMLPIEVVAKLKSPTVSSSNS